MRRAVLLIAAALAASGCKPEPVTKSVLAQEAEVEARAAQLQGWQRLFGSPKTTIPAVNQYGFRAEPYTAKAGGYEAKGAEVPISNTFAKAPNKVSFAATGREAGAIDAFRFALAITDPPQAPNAKTRFAKLITDFMFSSKAPGAKAVTDAVMAEQPVAATLPGAGFALDVKPIEGAAQNRVLTVTFTRPDTKSNTSKS